MLAAARSLRGCVWRRRRGAVVWLGGGGRARGRRGEFVVVVERGVLF
jgi:hypothetical protein